MKGKWLQFTENDTQSFHELNDNGWIAVNTIFSAFDLDFDKVRVYYRLRLIIC